MTRNSNNKLILHAFYLLWFWIYPLGYMLVKVHTQWQNKENEHCFDVGNVLKGFLVYLFKSKRRNGKFMESLVLQKEKGVCSDSPSIWFHSVAGVLFRTWRQVQVAQRHADIGSVTAAGSYFAYLPLVIIDWKILEHI